MAKNLWLTRDDGELLVEVLEAHFVATKNGVCADLAMQIRELFGMCAQPDDFADLVPAEAGQG